jgi:hypothetical protein
MRVTHRGTRFVSPAGSGRGPHPLSRSHSRNRPRVPSAIRAAVVRDPVGAIRRSARSLTPEHRADTAPTTALRPASIHWSSPHRALRDPRSFRAVTRPR